MNTTPNLGRRISALVAAFVSIATFPALAAVAPLSPAELQGQASHIVTGSVVGITSNIEKRTKGFRFKRIYTIRIKVEKVSKGTGLVVGSEIEALAWQPFALFNPEVGNQEHDTIPKKGDRATLYLRSKGKKQFEPLFPNGIELVGAKP